MSAFPHLLEYTEQPLTEAWLQQHLDFVMHANGDWLYRGELSLARWVNEWRVALGGESFVVWKSAPTCGDACNLVSALSPEIPRDKHALVMPIAHVSLFQLMNSRGSKQPGHIYSRADRLQIFLDAYGVYGKPPGQSPTIVLGIDYDGDAIIEVREDVNHPLPFIKSLRKAQERFRKPK